MDAAPHICLVSTDRDPAGGPDWRLGEVLAAAGWDVHLLACAPGAEPCAGAGRLRVSRLADYPEAPDASVPEWVAAFERPSLHLLAALERLHAERRFDIVQYSEESGIALRTAQARRTGVALAGAVLVARLRGPSGWRRTQDAQWMCGPPDAVLDFAEQTAFELADVHTAPTEYLLDEARRLGWDVPAGAAVLPDCPAAAAPPGRVPSGAVDEVVFAGSLDKLHGLRVFIRALAAVPVEVPVALVGANLDLDGVLASQWARSRLKGRRVFVRDAADPAAVLAYLRGGNRLAVLPYLTATDTELVRDLARARVPFLVSDFGPAAELVADAEARRHLLFDTSATELGRTLNAYLAAPVERRREWIERLAAAHDPQTVGPAVRIFYARLLASARAKRVAAAPRAVPKVTVGITHYNLGKYLPATLASVAAQTYPNLEVVVADDGSNDPESVAVVAEMERRYPAFRFVRGPNVGVCGNRNRCLEAATGELFFPLDADNIAAPEMIERLVTALELQPPDTGAVSCFWLGFTGEDELRAGRYCGAYRPTGGPRVVVGLWNPYGETSGLFRTALVRELGGYDDLHPEYMSEDWHLYIKIAARGLKVAVIPKALYYYRVRPDSRYRTGDHGVNHLRVLPDVSAIPFTAAERLTVCNMLAGLMKTAKAVEEYTGAVTRARALLEDRLRARRYRLLDRAVSLVRRPVSVLRGVARRVWGGLDQRRWRWYQAPAGALRPAGSGAMRGVLKSLGRPWRWVRGARALKNTIVALLRQVLDLQHEVKGEVRELHRSGLLAAIQVIEEQQRAREVLDQECARLERRLDELERRLAASGAGPAGAAPDRAAA